MLWPATRLIPLTPDIWTVALEVPSPQGAETDPLKVPLTSTVTSPTRVMVPMDSLASSSMVTFRSPVSGAVKVTFSAATIPMTVTPSSVTAVLALVASAA